MMPANLLPCLAMTYHFNQWLLSLKHYVLMCLFVSGPDRLPNNLHSILFSLLCYYLLGFLWVDEQRSYATLVLHISLELALLILIIYIGLKQKNKLSRFYQSFSALLGVNIVISAVSIPVLQSLAQDYRGVGELNRNLLNAELTIVLWNLSVMSLILKRALNIKTGQAAMISFIYFMFYQFLVIWIF